MKEKRIYQPAEGLSEREQRWRRRRGLAYRFGADTVTYGRTLFGGIASIGILAGGALLPKAIQHRTIGLAAGVAGLGALDKVDGILARKAVENGIPILDRDKKKDPKQDKIFAHMMMASIAVREVLDGNESYGYGILACQAIKGFRDHKMSQSRARAVPGADIGAIQLNKFKTGAENLGHMLATSPIAESAAGRFCIVATYGLSNTMGIVGYKQADRQHQTPVVPHEQRV